MWFLHIFIEILQPRLITLSDISVSVYFISFLEVAILEESDPLPDIFMLVHCLWATLHKYDIKK